MEDRQNSCIIDYSYGWWFEVEGDIEDFIFSVDSEAEQSER